MLSKLAGQLKRLLDAAIRAAGWCPVCWTLLPGDPALRARLKWCPYCDRPQKGGER